MNNFVEFINCLSSVHFQPILIAQKSTLVFVSYFNWSFVLYPAKLKAALYNLVQIALGVYNTPQAASPPMEWNQWDVQMVDFFC